MDLLIRIDGQDRRVQAQILEGHLWIHFDGITRKIEPEMSSRRAKSANQAASNEIRAPMPGKVTKLLVEPGQTIKKGDAIVVMEAMKMEYTLKSDIDSEVLEIKCDVLAQVNLGQMLVLLKPVTSGDKK